MKTGALDSLIKIGEGYSPKGALILGGLGAGLGALVNRKKRLRGAVLGGLLGAAGGSALDVSRYLKGLTASNKTEEPTDSGQSSEKPEAKSISKEDRPAAAVKSTVPKPSTGTSVAAAADKPAEEPGLYQPKWHEWETPPPDGPVMEPVYTYDRRGRKKVKEYIETDELPDAPPAKLISENSYEYKIRPGDTLLGLAHLEHPDYSAEGGIHNRTARRDWLKWVLWANPDINPDKLRVGQKIIIPPEAGYQEFTMRDYLESDPDDKMEQYEDFQRRLAEEAERLGVPASDLD